MTWFTFIHGLALFGIGTACRFVLRLEQWQALLPIVMGLGYLTLAEGLRSKSAQRRLFLFLAILWSVVILVVSLPLSREVLQIMQHQPVMLDGREVRSELVMEHTVVFIMTMLYSVIAVRSLLQRSKPTTPSPAH